MKNIAVIPARSGSKGIIDKNIKMLAGKPLLAYSIEAALKSGIFDTVHVSTDSEKYAEIGGKYGADIPFLRDEALAGDNVSTLETIQWILKKYIEIGNEYDNVMVLQPTSPLRDETDINSAYDLFIKKEAEAVISVCECEHSPLWCNMLPDDGNMENFIEKSALRPRQQIPTYFRLNGAIYLYKVDFVLNSEHVYTDKTYAHIMDITHSIDIDNEFDFQIAQMCMEQNKISK